MRVLPILFLLGAYHGLNPAMGWLFAVARGLQGRTVKGVVNSLMPLGLGHLASVAAVLGAVQVARFTLPVGVVRVIAAIILIGFGLYRLVRRRHPRWVGMQVGPGDLTLWSFLMASAHGAGLMLLPFVLTYPGNAMPNTRMHHLIVTSAMAAPSNWAMEWWFVVVVHTLGYLLATALLALLVYYKLGVAVLRRAWFNLDLLWVGALIAAGVLTLIL